MKFNHLTFSFQVRVIDLTQSLPNVTLKYDTLEEDFKLTDGKSEFQRLSPKEYKVMSGDMELGEAFVYQDGVYDVVLTDGELFLFPMTAPADVHMMWLFPQYLIITIGEVLFSVSGMDFAYSQAPTSMKSTLQAANLFTITVGLWLFAGLTSLSAATGAFQHRASHEAFLYAGLMFANTVIFILLLRWYNKGPAPDDDGQGEPVTGVSKAQADHASHDNPGFICEEAL